MRALKAIGFWGVLLDFCSRMLVPSRGWHLTFYNPALEPQNPGSGGVVVWGLRALAVQLTRCACACE